MRKRAHIRGDSGQMAVELAILMPVVLVIAIIAANLFAYMGACVRFDRVASEAVRVNGVSPGYGEYSSSICEQNIADAISSAFVDQSNISIEVSSREISSIGGLGEITNEGLIFSLVPSYREYTCTMNYSVPFFENGIFGFAFPELQHESVYIVDPFESGLWS